jgi:hypothetical protein
MTNPENGHSELPIITETGALANPTYEEGGGAKLRKGAGANAGLAALYENGPADFCITEKKGQMASR